MLVDSLRPSTYPVFLSLHADPFEGNIHSCLLVLCLVHLAIHRKTKSCILKRQIFGNYHKKISQGYSKCISLPICSLANLANAFVEISSFQNWGSWGNWGGWTMRHRRID